MVQYYYMARKYSIYIYDSIKHETACSRSSSFSSSPTDAAHSPVLTLHLRFRLAVINYDNLPAIVR